MDDPSPNAVGDKAFDMWLGRCLREQCAAVVTKPVPLEWIDLIEGTREAPDQSRDR